MCSVSNSPSLKERVQCYINKKDEIANDYKNRLSALYEEGCADILSNCPIKVGDVYVTKPSGSFDVKRQYYKVAKFDVNINGTIAVYGHKSKLDGTWGKRDNIFMFCISVFSDYAIKDYTKVENYVERNKD